MSLSEKVLTGDVRAAARLMRDIDDNRPSAVTELKQIYARTGNAYIIGITGPPGAGKSTLVDQLTASFRKQGKKVGVVAIDPTSPFTGGAILGDRIRMNRHATDDGVFIRSLATRGALGGLSRSTSDVALVLDALGMDIIIIETVGVGQDEVDIVKAAHTTCVVMVPGMGDDIQAIKAGILEIGDVFVVNKADREGADRTARELAAMLEMRDTPQGDWQPQVFKTEAQRGTGIDELVGEILTHRDHLFSSGLIETFLRERNERHFVDILRDSLYKHAMAFMDRTATLPRVLDGMADSSIDPYSAAEEVIAEMLGYDPQSV
ncbi:methylmalonyl Co-A mutase-associated GTPase MeaB [Pelotalea chapellei]|uniref:Methylmalonyl Co-A mutase-associated GTPase MeaB n=1 Tax=Pelotalea chapellei TaxID=44671 RepID=A0ABS5U8K7_9BACT|nr:methylmalonyl Co-A mutase-associated GTPase MeaB [Pelotalea chapellei]MBT1071998.1 methylmalonyl Co-A mutase-associated GTPase MeaB [Pelotalea chapellei]